VFFFRVKIETDEGCENNLILLFTYYHFKICGSCPFRKLTSVFISRENFHD
jgi:hypothetical protein